MFADGYLHSLMDDLAAETQAYRPAALYLNGEYWGLHNLRERYDQHYLATVHGADPDHIVILDQMFGTHQVQRGPEGAADPLNALIAAVAELDPAAPDFEAQLEALVEPQLDLASFLDFVIAHTFAGNWDWPGNNTRVWRALPDGEGHGGGDRGAAGGDGSDWGGSDGDGSNRVGGVAGGAAGNPLDGRWRWMVFDLDHAGERAGRFNVDYDVFTDRMAPTDDPTIESGYPAMFHRLMQHPGYRDQFLNRFADLLATDLASDRTIAELDRLEALLTPEMARHIDRWQTHDSLDDWRSLVASKRAFMLERPDRQRRHLEMLFGLAPVVPVTVRSDEGGTVLLNGLDLPPSGLTGEYWHGVPVTITARPDDGHCFLRWDGAPAGTDPTDATVSIDPGDGLDLTAVFEPR